MTLGGTVSGNILATAWCSGKNLRGQEPSEVTDTLPISATLHFPRSPHLCDCSQLCIAAKPWEEVEAVSPSKALRSQNGRCIRSRTQRSHSSHCFCHLADVTCPSPWLPFLPEVLPGDSGIPHSMLRGVSFACGCWGRC